MSTVQRDGAAPAATARALAVPAARFGLLLVMGGGLGLLAAFVLTVERFRLVVDASYVPSCSLNPVLSCGSVMTQPQASLLGFPNSLVGVVAFTVPVVLGAVVLLGGELPRWLRTGWWAGTAAGLACVVWLAAQSLFVIHALCPYCLVVWAVVIPLFWTSTADLLDRSTTPGRPTGLVVTAVVEYRLLLVLMSYAVVVALIGIAFWDYWLTVVTP